MWTDEERVINIVSDHNILTVECLLNGTNEVKEKNRKKKKWMLRCRVRQFPDRLK